LGLSAQKLTSLHKEFSYCTVLRKAQNSAYQV
jgi:hypothetical protein